MQIDTGTDTYLICCLLLGLQYIYIYIYIYMCTWKHLRLPHRNDAKITMVHRCKKCSDISEVTSGGRGEIGNVKNDRLSEFQFHLCQQMLLEKSHCTFYIYGALGKKAFCRILKRWFIGWITCQNVQRLQIFAILASYLWGNLKFTKEPWSTCINILVTLSMYVYYWVLLVDENSDITKSIIHKKVLAWLLYLVQKVLAWLLYLVQWIFITLD